MRLKVIGGGLAGTEAAWQAAEQGVKVNLYEMRPSRQTGAHRTGDLAELVCSNSLGSNLPSRASGLLKNELRRLGSMLIECADASAVPAGGALAVDRAAFSRCVEQKLRSHPLINVIREEITTIPNAPVIIATGPLTSPDLSGAIRDFTGEEHLYFYDALAPIVQRNSIDMSNAFRANRYNHGVLEEGDYINCPLNEEEYDRFRQALLEAKRIPLRSFEQEIDQGVIAGGKFFQGCQPIEIIASRGEKAMAFGPMRPVGLTDPRTGRWPFAVVQLRQDNLLGDLYNLVGFQTNLTFNEQARVFRLIPGLEHAVFTRYGQMHRNTFISSPNVLEESLASKENPGLFFAGQIAGVEGYAGNIASGLIAGLNAAGYIKGLPAVVLPQTTMIGALLHYITHANPQEFQPVKAMFGVLPPPDDQVKRNKKDRFAYYAQRAQLDLESYLSSLNR